jgi:uncharacterized protein YcfL
MSALRSLALIVMTVALTACTTVNVTEGPSPAVRVQDDRAPYATIRYDTVVVTDKSLTNWHGKVYEPDFWNYLWPDEAHKRSKIAVETISTLRTATGTLQVETIIRNRTDYPLQVEGRTHFFDEQKLENEKPSAWQRVYLSPQAIATYRETSTGRAEVAHYYVELREGR